MTPQTKQKEKQSLREFSDDLTHKALQKCQDAGYTALFMPELIKMRTSSPSSASIWKGFWSSPSITVTGKTGQGNKVVVYAHVPNHLSNPENIQSTIKKGLVNGAGLIPQEEFERLLSLEDNKRVFVVDYEILKNSSRDIISLADALKHPQTIPFCGGEKIAEQYLKAYGNIKGDKIRVGHSDNSSDKGPLARLLFLGRDENYGTVDCLFADTHALYLPAHFCGKVVK